MAQAGNHLILAGYLSILGWVIHARASAYFRRCAYASVTLLADGVAIADAGTRALYGFIYDTACVPSLVYMRSSFHAHMHYRVYQAMGPAAQP